MAIKRANIDLLDDLNQWGVELKKLAADPEAEEKKQEDPEATPGAFAKENEADLKKQSDPAGVEHAPEGTSVLETRDDETVADADSMDEIKNDAPIDTPESETKKEQDKIASILTQLLEAIDGPKTAGKKPAVKPAPAAVPAKKTPVTSPQITEKTAGLELAQANQIAEAMCKQAGIEGPVTFDKLAGYALDKADEAAHMLVGFVNNLMKAAADEAGAGAMPQVSPEEQQALEQALMQQLQGQGGAGGAPAAAGGAPEAGGGMPPEAAAAAASAGAEGGAGAGAEGGAGEPSADQIVQELANLSPEELQQILAQLGAGTGGETGQESEEAPAEEAAEKPEPAAEEKKE